MVLLPLSATSLHRLLNFCLVLMGFQHFTYDEIDITMSAKERQKDCVLGEV